MNTIFDEDLQRIQKQAGAIWQELDNSHIFLTGGTGFFGRWLLHSMKHAIDAIGSERILFGTDWSATWRFVSLRTSNPSDGQP